MMLLPVALSAPPLADPGYRSILGDPGMRARESTTALSGWNFCDGVAQPPAFPLSATPRLADCWVDGANRVTQAANDLAFPGSPIPGQPATHDIELYYRQKEVYLAMRWGMSEFEDHEVQRPEYDGQIIRSYIDGSDMKYFPSAEKKQRRCCASSGILSLLGVVVACVIVVL